MLLKEFSLVICALSFALSQGTPYYDHRQTYEDNYHTMKANRDVELDIRVGHGHHHHGSHSSNNDVNLGVNIDIHNHGSESLNYDEEYYDPNELSTAENDYPDELEDGPYTAIYGLKNASPRMPSVTVADRVFIEYVIYTSDAGGTLILDGGNLDEDDITFLNLLSINSKVDETIEYRFLPFERTVFNTLSDYVRDINLRFHMERRAWQKQNLLSNESWGEYDNRYEGVPLVGQSSDKRSEEIYDDRYDEDDYEYSTTDDYEYSTTDDYGYSTTDDYGYSTTDDYETYEGIPSSEEVDFNSTEVRKIAKELAEYIMDGIFKYSEK